MVAVLATCAAAALGLLAILGWWLHGYAEQWRTQWAFDRAPTGYAGDAAARPAEDRRIPPPPTDKTLANARLRGNPGQFFGTDAYPVDAIRANREGRTVAKLAVDGGGTPVGCVVVVTSGSRSLDAATCSIALGKVRFSPARDGSGRPVPSSYTLPVRWVLPHD
jgi:protein TonB